MKTFLSFKAVKEFSAAVLSVLFLGAAVFLSSCSQQESFLTSGNSQYYIQDLNPPYLDILWVIDDRSPMYYIQNHLVDEAEKFFQRLDSIPNNYQMGITTMDTLINKGALKPASTILTKEKGTLEQRVAIFSNILSQVINLRTGAENTGFQAALLSLQNQFKPRAGVPLVIVFISDGDDFSTLNISNQTDAVEYVATQLLSLKENKQDLLKVYSINYVPFTGSQNFNEIRCATLNNADIDKAGTGAIRSNGQPWFQDRYFRLARRLGGDTADLCSTFSEKINLAGLQLKSLTTRFKVTSTVSNANQLQVIVTDSKGNTLNLSWTYNSATQEVVFSTAPPEGSRIQIIVAGQG